jgi:transcriptional regulator with XRE-family HTH domain
MEKQKLVQARKQKGITQKKITELLCMDVSNYNRKEKGKLSMRHEEWEKIAEYLGVPIEEIYEAEQQQIIICKDQAIGIGVNNGTNNVYTIPEFILESQRKYIQKLEEEIKRLKASDQKN